MSDEPILDIDKLAVVEVSTERLGATGCDERDQRIAALEAQLAEANERCDKAVAAIGLIAVQQKNTASTFSAWRRNGCFDAEAVEVWAHNDSEAVARIAHGYNDALAAVREEAKREGAVEELNALRVAWATYAAVTDSIDRRIAALEGKG